MSIWWVTTNNPRIRVSINTYMPIISYLLRCNTDVTCLLSGTTIKAVISYIANYITKSLLNTATMFDLIANVFERNMKYIKEDASQEENTSDQANCEGRTTYTLGAITSQGPTR